MASVLPPEDMHLLPGILKEIFLHSNLEEPPGTQLFQANLFVEA
jgi:hypothetical protein